jgi:LysR family glycine cleavage system transcriptional activator
LHQAVYPPADDAIKNLQISTLASTAKEWLLPRLPDFAARHPDIRLIIHTDYALVKPAPRLAMVALRHGVRQGSDQICETLFTDKLVAVVAPHLQASLGADPSLWPAQAMLQHLSLDAQTWLAAAGLPEEFVPQGQAFNDADVLLEAAQYGLGVALTRLSIVWRRLQEGRLALACDVVCPSPRDNLLVLREDSAGLPEVRTFTLWIRDQAKRWQTQVDEFNPRAFE